MLRSSTRCSSFLFLGSSLNVSACGWSNVYKWFLVEACYSLTPWKSRSIKSRLRMLTAAPTLRQHWFSKRCSVDFIVLARMTAFDKFEAFYVCAFCALTSRVAREICLTIGIGSCPRIGMMTPLTTACLLTRKHLVKLPNQCRFQEAIKPCLGSWSGLLTPITDWSNILVVDGGRSHH